MSDAARSAGGVSLTLADVREAHARIRPYIHRTPVMTSATLDELAGGQLYFKCENFQKIGAFKARGAHNAVFALTPQEAAHGVATHSSGNHGAAVALAARSRGIPAYVVMPSNVAAVKKEAVARYGAQVTFCEPSLAARERTVEELLAATHAYFVHPYNDLRVMAGQGTSALELLEEIPDLDVIVCPVGGGGQIAGVAVAAKGVKPGIRVIGAEPAAADDARRSLQSGTRVMANDPQTIADGLRASLGELSFALIRAHVDDIVTVSEEAIVNAMRRVWEVMKIVIEPSAAVPVAALLEGALPAAGRRVGVILSGGNVDTDRLPWMKG